MKKVSFKIFILLTVIGFGLSTIFTLSAFRKKEKVKIGFLIHDLVGDRWKKDTESFAAEVDKLGGEVTLENAFGDAKKQVEQGKALIDKGIKVIAVVPENAIILAELVEYANKKGAKIIAYDRMILNCKLDYYISFNSVKVGELMAQYALTMKPKGNYVILNGPSSDNNALLVRQGVMNKIKKLIDNGDIKILMEKEIDAWYALNSYMTTEEFISNHKGDIDVIIAASDDLATGAIDAISASKGVFPGVITGQDASLDACKNIIQGRQTMTVYKSIKKLSSEAAILAMKLAKNEKVKATAKVSNGKYKIPSILFDPVSVDKFNLRKVLIGEGHFTEADLVIK